MPANSCPETTPMPALPARNGRRYLALWFPFLSTDRARQSRTIPHNERPDERPFALIEKDRGALRLAALDQRAVRSGLRPGMALAEARALVPQLATLEAHPAADAALLVACAEACEIFTPLVALRGADGLVLDITGCLHLFGGEEAMLQRACRRMAAFGLTACAASAGTPDAAWAFARYRRNRIAGPGEEERLARALPLAALEKEAGTILALSRAGFRSLGDLAERPSHLLAARFGEDLVASLNRILGREDIRITPLRPPPLLMAERHFPEPITEMEHLLAVLERLMGDIARRLEARGEGGRAFELTLFRADGAVRRIGIETAAGTREAASLVRLARLKMETLADPVDPGFGFDALRLLVLRSEALHAAQASLAEGTPQEDETRALSDLMNRLVARFGRESLRRFVARDTHDPERAGGTVAALAGGPEAAWPEPEAGQPPARPLTLFAHPHPIEVLAEVPDSPPLRFRWRRMLHEVTRAEGPERIAPEWWRFGHNAPATRDYYRIEDQAGHRFWVFREGFYEDSTARPRWFLHGLFA
jgi:protein ImuB